jgi:hypothetical protein
MDIVDFIPYSDMRKGYGKGYGFFTLMTARRSDILSLELLDNGAAPLIS